MEEEKILNENVETGNRTQLIFAFKKAQDESIGKVEKYDIPIANANGVPVTPYGLTPENAQKIIANVKKFKKDSARFTTDNTRVVLHKKVFDIYCSNTKAIQITANQDGLASIPFLFDSRRFTQSLERINSINKKIFSFSFFLKSFIVLISFILMTVNLIMYYKTTVALVDYSVSDASIIASTICASLYLLFFLIRWIVLTVKNSNDRSELWNDRSKGLNGYFYQRKVLFVENINESEKIQIKINLKNYLNLKFIEKLNKFTLEAIKDGATPKYLFSEENIYLLHIDNTSLEIADNVTWFYQIPSTDVVVISNLRWLKKLFYLDNIDEIKFDDMKIFL